MGLQTRKSATDAIVKLLSQEIGADYRALPQPVRASLPEKLKLDTEIAREKDSTPPGTA
jgi:hypothetical protein